LGLKGKAKINSDLTAGYRIEFELYDSASKTVSNFVEDGGQYLKKGGDDEGNLDNTLSLRQNYWYIDSLHFGRISLGHQSTAADGAYEVNLSKSTVTSNVLVGNNFFIRDAQGDINGGRLKNWASNLDAGRNDVIRYDTPTFYGFILSTSWGDNDYGDVALRFKREFGNFRLAAAIAYQWDTQNEGDTEFETFGGSVSIMHVPSGLYGTFQAAERDYEVNSKADTSFWYVQGGVERRVLPLGATTLYAEYGEYSDYAAGLNLGTAAENTEATRLGVGLNQRIDSAAMDLYVHGTMWSFDQDATAAEQEDLTTILLGSRIKF
jgi:hypothetical protein